MGAGAFRLEIKMAFAPARFPFGLFEGVERGSLFLKIGFRGFGKHLGGKARGRPLEMKNAHGLALRAWGCCPFFAFCSNSVVAQPPFLPSRKWDMAVFWGSLRFVALLSFFSPTAAPVGGGRNPNSRGDSGASAPHMGVRLFASPPPPFFGGSRVAGHSILKRNASPFLSARGGKGCGGASAARAFSILPRPAGRAARGFLPLLSRHLFSAKRLRRAGFSFRFQRWPFFFFRQRRF